MNKKAIITAMLALAVFSLASCSNDDDNKDITKEIIMNVSAEPGSTAWESIPLSVCK